MPPTQDPPKAPTRQGKHLGIQMPTRLRPEVYAIVDALAGREDRTVAKMGEILIREALQARGLLPLPESEEPPPATPKPARKPKGK